MKKDKWSTKKQFLDGKCCQAVSICKFFIFNINYNGGIK